MLHFGKARALIRTRGIQDVWTQKRANHGKGLIGPGGLEEVDLLGEGLRGCPRPTLPALSLVDLFFRKNPHKI